MRLSLRDLVWTMTAVSILLGWWIDARRRNERFEGVSIQLQEATSENEEWAWRKEAIERWLETEGNAVVTWSEGFISISRGSSTFQMMRRN